MASVTSSTVTRPITCATCRRSTTNCNLVFDYRTMIATAVCEHCRQPLPKIEDTDG